MSVEITTRGFDELIVDLERLRQEASFKWPKEILDGAAEILSDEIRDQAKGSIKDSVRVEETKDNRRVIVDSPHAKFVNDGTGPSIGRYVPAIGRRLIDITRNIGMHPGIRASHFFDRAITFATPRIFGFVHRKLHKYLMEL